MAEEPEITLPMIHWIIEKAMEFQKSIYFCFFDSAKAFDCVDYSKLWKILRGPWIQQRSCSEDWLGVQKDV